MSEVENNKLNSKEYFSIKKTTLALIAAVLFVVGSLTFTVVSAVKINDHEKRLVALESTVDNIDTYLRGGNSNSGETLELESQDYYKEYELTDEMMKVLENDNKDRIYYFHQASCQYCLQTNVIIDSYIQKGYQNKVGVYFATPETGSAFTKYEIESTPTAVRISPDGTTQSYVGYDEIFNLLDSVVNE